jgi:hypothetical protein
MSWKFIPKVDIHILELLVESIQDGGRCGSVKELISMLLITRTSTWVSKEKLIPREDISLLTKQRMDKSINSGI